MTDEPAAMPATYDAALAAVQAELPDIVKARTAIVPTKSGGSYTYDYADLPAVSRIIVPMLAKVGLNWSAKPTVVDGEFRLIYRLKHVSGESDGGEWPLPMPGRATPQEVGGAITYARRYALCSMTGVAPEGDDDDAAASERSQRRGRQTAQRRAQPARQADGPPAQTMQRAPQGGPPLPGEPGFDQPPGPADADQITQWQVRKMNALFRERGIEDKSARLGLASHVAGRPLTSSMELTKREASMVIDAIPTYPVAESQPAPAPEPPADPAPETPVAAAAEPDDDGEIPPEGVGVSPEELAQYEQGALS